MADSTTLPNWVRKVARANRKRPTKCEQTICTHPIEVESETVTFSELRKKVWGATPEVASAIERLGVPEAEKRRIVTRVFDQLDDLGPKLWQRLCAEARREFEQSNRVEQLDVGPVSYHLRKPLAAHIAPSPGHGWEYSIDHFSPRFVGHGDSIAAAHRDFLNTVHSVFQSLVQTRRFELDDAQRTDWQILEDLIDIDKYWDSVPVTMLEIGVVCAITGEGRGIAWLDGDRREFVAIERTLPEFAAFGEGQWFEALVERQPKTYQLQKLSYVRPISPIRQMTDEEFRQWVRELPADDNVPRSGTDWATL